MSESVNEFDGRHPHERDGRNERAVIDAEGRCLVCIRDHAKELKALLDQLKTEVVALRAFKAWTHSFLDAKGIPANPGGPHTAEGCRIGDRMELVFAELERLRAAVKLSADEIPECQQIPSSWCRVHDAPRKSKEGELCDYGQIRQRLIDAQKSA